MDRDVQLPTIELKSTKPIDELMHCGFSLRALWTPVAVPVLTVAHVVSGIVIECIHLHIAVRPLIIYVQSMMSKK